jgi:hypothetical protein
MTRKAPYSHQDGTNCWTKNCSRNHTSSRLTELQHKIESLFSNTSVPVLSPALQSASFVPQSTVKQLLKEYGNVLTSLTFEDASIEAEETATPPLITVDSLRNNRWGSVNNCTPATIAVGEFIEKHNLFKGEVFAISIQFKPNKTESTATFHNALLLVGEDGNRTVLDYTAAQWGGNNTEFPVQMTEQDWISYTEKSASKAYQLEIENVEIL